MRLVDAYKSYHAARVLYDLLAERPRENWISHARMPTWTEHCAFIMSKPFYLWYLIVMEDESYIGAIEVTDRNEIGIAVFNKYRRQGLGRQALELFMRLHHPLPAIPAVRNGRWLSNIATRNIGSKLFFARCGFKALQETWCLPQQRTIPAHLISDDATGVLTVRAPWDEP